MALWISAVFTQSRWEDTCADSVVMENMTMQQMFFAGILSNDAHVDSNHTNEVEKASELHLEVVYKPNQHTLCQHPMRSQHNTRFLSRIAACRGRQCVASTAVPNRIRSCIARVDTSWSSQWNIVLLVELSCAKACVTSSLSSQSTDGELLAIA